MLLSIRARLSLLTSVAGIINLFRYSTWDWKTFKNVGTLDTFGTGDCPDFYPIPPACPGCANSGNLKPAAKGEREHGGAAKEGEEGEEGDEGEEGGALEEGSLAEMKVGQQKWTHIKAGGGKGVYALGEYSEGPANSTGTWVQSNTTVAIQMDNGGPVKNTTPQAFIMNREDL